MQNLQQFKANYLSKFSQLILLDESGHIEKSCDSIFSTQSLQTDSALNFFPFLESIFPNLLELKVNGPELRFTKVETPLPELPGIYDFTFARILLDTKQPHILWSIYDYTKLYEDLMQFQQSRNELEILRETLERRNKQLKYQKDILAHENLLLGNLNKLEKDYYNKVRTAVQSPVNVLDGLSFILSNLADRNETDDYMSALRSSVIHLQEIIAEMEAVSAVNTDHSSIDLIHLKKTVDKVQEQISITSEEKLIPIVNIEANVPLTFKGDPNHLKQILYGLLINSYQYGQYAMVSLQIGVQEISSTTCLLEFKVIEKLQKSPSAKLPPKEKITEMVLRLSLVKKLVEIHGGTIEVDHRPNKGIIIQCLLPFSL